MKKTNITVSFLVIVFTCFVTLFLIEVCYRGYVRFQKPLHHPSSFPDLGWELTSGAKIVEKNREGIPITYSINSAGFRDGTNGEWKQWKYDDIKIAFIGDSITYGAGVNYENTFSGVVESLFSKIKLKARTVNLGISGFNALQHLAIIKHKTIPLDPDIIVLAYFLNDTERRKTQKLPGSFQYILRHFHFGTFLIKRVITYNENKNAQTSENVLLGGKENIKKVPSCNGYAEHIINSYNTVAWEDNKRVILSMKDLCIQKGNKKFAMVIFPFEDQINGICPTTPQKKIAEFLSKNGIPFLDMTKVYGSYPHKEELYFNGDNIHPNNKGHYIAGKVIFQWLISEFKLTDEFQLNSSQ